MSSAKEMPGCDVAVIGGGPAGSAAARLLATWGRDVTLLTGVDDRSRDLAVSVPPSAAKLLEQIGVLDAVDAAGFVRSTGNTVWWGHREPRSQSFAAGHRGYQVRHSAFDGLLRSAAAAGGASVVAADVAAADVDGESVRLRVQRGETTQKLSARFVLDASGRQGVIARPEGLRREDGPRTFALVGEWEHPDGWDVRDDTHTLVESFADGWAWSVPVGEQFRYLTCMLDPATSDAGEGNLGERYTTALQRTRVFRRLLAGARPVGSQWGCDASWYRCRRASGDRFLLVGDAASFVDPLSSFGVQKALGSAWLGAIVANTVLTCDETGSYEIARAARELFDRHEQQVYGACRRQASGFFDQVAVQEDHAFWTGRGEEVGGAPGEPQIEAFRRDPEVRDAFEKLRAAPSIRLAPGPDVSVVRAPAIGERSIVLDDHLATPALPDGIRFLRGVDVRRLVELAPGHTQVPDLYEAYNRDTEPVPLPDFLGALAVLLAKHVLRLDTV